MSDLVEKLEADGIVLIHDLLSPQTVQNMQRAFQSRLARMRWNDFDGYEQTEPYRHMLQDVLTLEQGFVDLAIHPVINQTIAAYVGLQYELVEAKGWASLPTRKDFHGWHGDAWYDQELVTDHIPREVKLAMYLTDVSSGHFAYAVGSHRQQHPRRVDESEMTGETGTEVMEVKGPAGTVFLFDTSGVHRQTFPILSERRAIFYCYHDPSVPLQSEDVEYYRYHPLILNAAFLGGTDEENRRVLGFGNKQNYVPAFERAPAREGLQSVFRTTFYASMLADRFASRVRARLKRTLGRTDS